MLHEGVSAYSIARESMRLDGSGLGEEVMIEALTHYVNCHLVFTCFRVTKGATTNVATAKAATVASI